MIDLGDVAGVAFCYLTTRGRVTGESHEIEIWFAASGSTIYLLAGGAEKADWVKNLRVRPEVSVRIGDRVFEGRGRLVEQTEEEAWARDALFGKYDPTYDGDLTGWSRTALPIAVDLRGTPSEIHLGGSEG